jgi:hypothetical protein
VWWKIGGISGYIDGELSPGIDSRGKGFMAGVSNFLVALGRKKVGSAVGSGQITVSGVPNCLNFSEMFAIYTIYKWDRGPRNTTWRTAGWKPMVYVKPRFAVACNVYYYYYHHHHHHHHHYYYHRRHHHHHHHL